MRKNIQLHIPEPCHEDWNSMVPVEKGRYCTSCQNQVIDFTNMSDQQLIAYFKKRNKDAICGRFMNDQLQRDILPQKTNSMAKVFFSVCIASPRRFVKGCITRPGKDKNRKTRHCDKC